MADGIGTNTDAMSWAKKLFAAVDEMRADSMVPFLDSSVEFGFGGAIAAKGEKECVTYLNAFFGTLAGIRHDLDEAMDSGNVRLVRGTVTYTVPRKGSCSTGFITYLLMKNGKAARYLAYVDTHPLKALQGG